MHKEEMEGGLRIGLGGTHPVCGEEMEGGAKIKLRGTRPPHREETSKGEKLKGCMQKGNGRQRKVRGLRTERRRMKKESSKR